MLLSTLFLHGCAFVHVFLLHYSLELKGYFVLAKNSEATISIAHKSGSTIYIHVWTYTRQTGIFIVLFIFKGYSYFLNVLVMVYLSYLRYSIAERSSYRIFKNEQVCMYSLADQNIDHCVELTFLEGKLGGFLILIFLISSFLNLLHVESERRFRWILFLVYLLFMDFLW